MEIPWRVKAPPQDCRDLAMPLAGLRNPQVFAHAIDRRSFLLAAAFLPFGHVRAAPKRDALRAAVRRIAEIERKAGGRLGVFVRDSGTGAELAHRAHERFPMCSTFKVLAAAAVLKKVDAARRRLDQAHPPTARRTCSTTRRRRRSMSPRAICASATSVPRRSNGATTRRQPHPEADRRTGGLHAIRAFDRRQGHPPRPHRADPQYGGPRRSARHHNAGRHRPHARDRSHEGRACPRHPPANSRTG